MSLPYPQPSGQMPEKLRFELWRRLENRLRLGEIIVSDAQIIGLMLKDFRKLVRTAPSQKVKDEIAQMVATVNRNRPETFLALGIKNAMSRFLNEGQTLQQRQANWQKAKQMIAENRMSDLLETIGVDIASILLTPGLEAVIRRMAQSRRPQTETDLGEAQSRKKRRTSATAMAPVNHSGADEGEEALVEQLTLPPPLSAAEEQRWTAEEQQREIKAWAEEEAQMGQYLQAYLQQGRVTAAEAEDLRTLGEIAARLQRGEIGPEEARKLRQRLPEDRRRPLELKMRQISEFAVLYKRLFEGLKRIPADRDNALGFLINHKDLIVQGGDEDDLGAIAEQLETDTALTENLIKIADRRDHEIRLIAAGLPPYRTIVGQGQAADLGQLQASFLEELRSWNRDQVSAVLNGDPEGAGKHLATNVRALVEIIGKLLVPGPFFRLIRWLKIKKVLIRYYNSANKPAAGPQKGP